LWQLGEGGEGVRRHAAGRARKSEADEASERREAAVALPEGSRRVERDVHAAAAGDALHLRLAVLCAVVDRVRDAGVSEDGVLAGRRRADHLGAGDATELDR